MEKKKKKKLTWKKKKPNKHKLVVIKFILFHSVMPREERSAVSLDIWDQSEI